MRISYKKTSYNSYSMCSVTRIAIVKGLVILNLKKPIIKVICMDRWDKTIILMMIFQ